MPVAADGMWVTKNMNQTRVLPSKTRLLAIFALGFAALALPPAEQHVRSQQKDDRVEVPDAPQAVLVPITLPIEHGTEVRLKRAVEKMLQGNLTGRRPVVVLEFTRGDEATAANTKFGPAYELANLLTQDSMSRVQTIAYLSEAVNGHAVLPVLACEQIVADASAKLGEAGIAEDVITLTHRAAYEEKARARATIPVPVALAMLDRDQAVFKVELLDGGARFIPSSELAEWRPKASAETEIVAAGDFANFTGEELRDHGFATHLVQDRRTLASALRVRPEDLQGTLTADEKWKGILVELNGPLHRRSVDTVLRAIRRPQADFNFVCLMIDSPGGSPNAAMALANELANVANDDTRVVAFVNQQALASAAVVALACDEVVMHPDGQLGGAGKTYISDRDNANLLKAIRGVAKARGRDWSMMAAMVDQNVKVYQYTNGAATRLFSEAEAAEQEDPDAWQQGELIDTREGLATDVALALRVAKTNANDLQELMQFYGIEEDLQSAEDPWLVDRLERLATQPWFARTLLFIAFFTLIAEFSAPGIGAPGFVSALCFLLFFWTQFLNGNVTWLEPLLFVGGVVCVAMEILVIPGFGIFGIGGALMVIASIVLASQTFVIPRNSYQYEQLPSSIFMAVWALSGGFVAMVVLRRYLHQAPILNRLLLRPPAPEEVEALHERESLVSWNHLLGKTGKATTQLTPSGKARFGDDIISVMSDGDLVEKGASVYVVEVQGSRIVVALTGAERHA